MIAIMTPNPADDTERLLTAIREILVDVRAQVYMAHPDLAQLIRAAEHLADAIQQPEERRELLDLLREYEQRHLGGKPRYSSLLDTKGDCRAQLRWDW